MLTLLAALAIPQTLPSLNRLPLPKDTTTFDFVVLGDNRPTGAGQPATPPFREILKEVGYIHPAFVLSLGDLLYGNEESFEQYKSEATEMQQILASLKVPIFNAPGNHELAGKPEFQKEYMSRFGPLWGSFDFGGCRFVATCTDEVGQAAGFSTAQQSWIEKTLADGKPSFVGMHRPIFARKGNKEEGASISGGLELHEQFRTHNVQAVFQAHDHVFAHSTRDGVEYFISGGAGAPLDATPEEGGYFHYILVHVVDGKATYQVMPLDSIQVSYVGSTIRVGDYAFGEVPLGDLTVHASKMPTVATAYLDKKGKHSPVPIKIEKVEKDSTGYTVHLSLTLGAHRQTVIQLK
jgi:hypothetical protein